MAIEIRRAGRTLGYTALSSTGLVLLSVTPAYAYIDPGTGTMLLQLIGAAVAGALFYFRNFKNMVVGWFTGRRADKDKSGDGPNSLP